MENIDEAADHALDDGSEERYETEFSLTRFQAK